MEMFEISLENLGFYGYIGVDDQERVVGNQFSVDITVVCDASDFVQESLDSTVSYADIYDIVSDHMSRQWLLLESVCESMVNSIFGRWHNIVEVSAKITKLAPPISGITGKSSVRYTKKAEKFSKNREDSEKSV